MNSMLSRVGVSTVEPYLAPRWDHEWRKIIDVIHDYHPGAADYAAIMPTAAIHSLRDDLRSVAPSLSDFASRLEAHIRAEGCGVYVPELGLRRFHDPIRACLLYALGACMGNPTSTDAQQRRVIWDVAPRPISNDYFPTFSEHDREAAFHTDTQYYPAPEKYFLLYVMKPARCFGGRSAICDARAFHYALEARSKRWILAALNERPLPFRVPSAFSPGAGQSKHVQATVAPIFSDYPFIRYRRDTLLDGLRHFPEYADPDVLHALNAFDIELQTSAVRAEIFMQEDSAMFIDNHTALHARTAFADRSRHLLRIRLHNGEEPRHRYEMISTQATTRSSDEDVLELVADDW